MTLVARIKAALEGSSYIDEGARNGLRDYHRANAVKAALRRRAPLDRLSGVREALNAYRVSAWLNDDGTTIRLTKNGQTVLTL
jgi:hypothetical protein